MSRSLFVPTLAMILLLPAALAQAEEPTLLERLSRECAEVAERARTAVVPVVSGARGGHGVVVGTPPLLVVPYEVGQEFTEIHLDDNSGITGDRIDGDAQLGIAVYRLPNQASRWRPLLVEREWKARRGSLALSGGPDLRLLVVKEVDSVRGALRVDGTVRDAVLLSPRGRLLGICAHPQPYYPWGDAWTAPYLSTYGPTSSLNFYGGPWINGRPLILADSWDSTRALSRPIAGWSSVPYFNDNVYSPDNAFGVPLPPGGYITPYPWWITAEPTIVPGPVIARVLDDIEEHGKIRHAYLGIVPGTEVDAEGITRIMLSAVLPESPAEKAGLKAGDTVTAFQGREIADLATFEHVLALLRPGDVLRVGVQGRDQEVKVVLGERSDARGKLVTPEDVGLEVVGLTPELNTWLGLPRDRTGSVVRVVREGSPAATAGIVKGDVIEQAAGHLVRDAAEMEAALAGATGNVVVRLARSGTTLEVTLALPAPAMPGGAR